MQDIEYEFNSTGTPQKNSVVERVFDTCYSCMLLIMAHMGLNKNLKTVLWYECSATETKLKNIMLHPHEEKCD